MMIKPCGCVRLAYNRKNLPNRFSHRILNFAAVSRDLSYSARNSPGDARAARAARAWFRWREVVTANGRWLRQKHVDALPQLANVLAGHATI